MGFVVDKCAIIVLYLQWVTQSGFISAYPGYIKLKLSDHDSGEVATNVEDLAERISKPAASPVDQDQVAIAEKVDR